MRFNLGSVLGFELGGPVGAILGGQLFEQMTPEKEDSSNEKPDLIDVIRCTHEELLVIIKAANERGLGGTKIVGFRVIEENGGWTIQFAVEDK